MRRSGFSLLELLIALSLILAMAALTLPVVSRTLAARDFESTVDRLTHQLRLARAQAQVSGRAVEVICTPDSGRIEARYFDAQQFETEVMPDDFASRDRMETNQEGIDSDSTVILIWLSVSVNRSPGVHMAPASWQAEPVSSTTVAGSGSVVSTRWMTTASPGMLAS